MNAARLALLAAIVAAAAAFFLLGGHHFGFDTLKAQQAAIEAWRAERPLLAAAAFFAVYVSITGLSLPGAALLTLAAGALFGLGWGALIVSFASSIGATLSFLAARFLLRDWVRERFAARLEPIDRGVRSEGALYLFTLRLLPAVPFFAINLAMGLTA